MSDLRGERTIKTIDGIFLSRGKHRTPDEGICLLEAVAFVQGEPFTAYPECVSTVLAEFGRQLNDLLPDGVRQELVRFIPMLPGTRDDGLDGRRGWIITDWVIRECLPAFFELVPELVPYANRLREFEEIASTSAAARVSDLLYAALDAADAAAAAAAARYMADAAD